MYHGFVDDQPLVVERRRELRTVVLVGKSLAATAAGVLTVCVLALAYRGLTISAPITALYGPSAGCSVDGPKYEPLTADALRLAVKAFVDTLGDDIKNQTYYPDAARQRPQWQICTIVQQCLVPKYGLPVGRLTPMSRTRFFEILALVLSDESYKRINVQQLSNLLLGEMQEWATSCAGTCHELNDPSGLLPNHLLIDDKLESHQLDKTYEECAELHEAGHFTFWSCDQSPKMLHHGNIDTTTGRYQLGNVFKEPQIHARNHHFDFVATYGSLEPGQPFGFRYSGHHFDLSFEVDAEGNMVDLPTFLGHNPLIVPQMSPPRNEGHEDYLQWHNMAGVPQFPDATLVVLEAAAALDLESYVPLNQFDSTPATGGLTLKGGKAISDVNHVKLRDLDEATWEKVWALVDYTLEFPRGAKARPERAAFRDEGRMIWTTAVHDHKKHSEHETPLTHLPTSVQHLVESRSFFYVCIETEELHFFTMVNSLFSLMLESEPSNHLHSILIPKSYLA